MPVCDICNSPRSNYLIDSDRLQDAVENGFNPYQLPHVPNPWVGMGVPPDFLFAEWKKKLYIDTTDWALCDVCHRIIDEILAKG